MFLYFNNNLLDQHRKMPYKTQQAAHLKRNRDVETLGTGVIYKFLQPNNRHLLCLYCQSINLYKIYVTSLFTILVQLGSEFGLIMTWSLRLFTRTALLVVSVSGNERSMKAECRSKFFGAIWIGKHGQSQNGHDIQLFEISFLDTQVKQLTRAVKEQVPPMSSSDL